MGVGPGAFNVAFRGKKGLKLRRCDWRSELMRFDIVPEIVFLQIGENDVVACSY